MGVFFVRPQEPDTATLTGPTPPPAELSWPRVAAAAVLLMLLLGGAIWTAEPANGAANRFGTLHPALVHGFELLLGTFVGLIAGEAVSSR